MTLVVAADEFMTAQCGRQMHRRQADDLARFCLGRWEGSWGQMQAEDAALKDLYDSRCDTRFRHTGSDTVGNQSRKIRCVANERDAMMRGDGDIVIGAAIANVTPAAVLAEQHRKTAEPGSGKK